VGNKRGVIRELETDRRGRLVQALHESFPDAADSMTLEIGFARAPGRVNLMGDHTDYNDGLVLSMAIGPDAWIAFRRRRDRLVRIVSLQGEKAGEFWIDDIPAGAAARGAAPVPWLDYFAGTAWSLREAGLRASGFDGVVDSTIPRGAGLASRAALELASAMAMISIEVPIAAPWLAALVQRGEREYVGVDNGLADHFASATGRAGRAIVLDCRSLVSRYVTMPVGVSVVVIDSGAPAEPSPARIAERRAECGRAVALLAEREPSIASLRDLDMATLRRHRHALPEKLARRAEHVVTENQRVGATAEALAAGDLDVLGRIFAESHESLRNRFEASLPALDALVGIARAEPGVVAARATGPGFGGCTVNLVRDEAVAALESAIAAQYEKRTGLAARLYRVSAAEGAGLV
jgi:galactokinase